MRSKLVRDYLKPMRVAEKSENVVGEDFLFSNNNGQIWFSEQKYMCCRGKGYIILDFGKEICGGVRIMSLYKDGQPHRLRARLRFGESLNETCAEIGEKNAGCDHSMRDMEIFIACTSDQEYGNTGFRFLRIDFKDDEEYRIINIYAAFTHRDLEYKGNFECNDEEINRIYDTARYTLFLNMQQQLWDGIKRDRMVWVGDMQPEVLAITDVFGADECVEEGIDISVLKNPLPCWLGNIPTYSFWMIQIIYDYYIKTGKSEFALKHLDYMEGVLAQLDKCVTEEGDIDYSLAGIKVREGYFLDWPTNATKEAKAGNRFMFVYVLKNMKKLYAALKRKESPLCDSLSKRLEKVRESGIKAKQIVALGYLSGLLSKEQTSESLTAGGGKGLSTFMSYFILKAISESADTESALKIMKEYYGGMLSRGATSFWEDFDIEWLEGSGRIDARTPEGLKDLHGDYGRFCYQGFRHSLCHGWSCGPVQFLTEDVMGIKVLESGCKKIAIAPRLGKLEYCQGTFPTPYGILSVRHERRGNEVRTEYSAPKEIEVIWEERK